MIFSLFEYFCLALVALSMMAMILCFIRVISVVLSSLSRPSWAKSWRYIPCLFVGSINSLSDYICLKPNVPDFDGYYCAVDDGFLHNIHSAYHQLEP